VAGLVATFGSGAMTNSINEFQNAECIFVIGSNTTEQHPEIGARIIEAAKKGAKIIVCDARSIRLVKYAAVHIKQRNGTDIALLNGIMNVIIQEDLYDKQFVAERTENFDALKTLVAKYTPEYVSKITGVPADDIIKAARIYATHKKSMIAYAMGITQHICGVDNVKTVANLAMLTGHVGMESTGVNPLRGQNNVQGACDMGGLPNVFTGYQKVTDEPVCQKFEKAWGVTGIPRKVGKTVTDMLAMAHKGELKALYIMGENPMMSDPDTKHVEDALKHLELLIVQDIFPNETTALAHVVLPGCTFAEKDGTFSNTERRVSRVRKAIEPIGESRQDWQIICDLAQRLGYPMKYSSWADILREINELTPSYAGITPERLETGFGIQWPCPNKDHPGTPYLHKGKFTKGLGTFVPCEHIEPNEVPDAEYPLTLTTGRVYWHYHTGSMTRRTNLLERECNQNFVEIHPDTAKSLNVRNGETVIVETRRGSIEIPTKITDEIVPGLIFVPFHFTEAKVNLLTNPAHDPVGKIPEYKVCAARIRKKG